MASDHLVTDLVAVLIDVLDLNRAAVGRVGDVNGDVPGQACRVVDRFDHGLTRRVVVNCRGSKGHPAIAGQLPVTKRYLLRNPIHVSDPVEGCRLLGRLDRAVRLANIDRPGYRFGEGTWR